MYSYNRFISMHWNLTRTRTLSSLSVVSPGSVDPFVSTSRFWRSQSRAKHCAQLNMTSNSNNRIIATSLYTKIASLLIQISPDFFFARQAKHMVLDIALLLGWAEVNCGAFRPRLDIQLIQRLHTNYKHKKLQFYSLKIYFALFYVWLCINNIS